MEQQFNEFLDEKNVSLDEILAFVDSSDFNLATETLNPQEETIGFFASSIDIEDSLESSQEHNPDCVKESKPSVIKEIQMVTTKDHDTEKVEHSGHSRKNFQERGRVRDRVIRFRGMVKRLEQQLEDLNNSRVRTQEHDNLLDESQLSAMNAGVEDRDAVTWQDIAMRQFAARREAEKENLSLRERLEEQLRVAKRLENLIRGYQVSKLCAVRTLELGVF
ncbi:hypothetical protein P3T76_010499 [Phytophthora citrophthora]|uniref:Uncharacterized protein n=1 Tax=Phytophthora citrophthora TaxID=4793 RepID=A0AAD9GCJ9_9STRA|nr:hypothetical protein P3T76_010499 [Phytophthora citrophthora]